ncbi:hypothetical protein ACCO45_010048 [Purpureocillium lilacinum]|uniref:Uncharacterized protein n=1 Tax=Purpureocillium lilacinum TaxID=33203 RepID=A0ACC4DGQ4_PURLI
MTELTNPVQQQRTQSAATDEKLIIALDFGTTYSGVSYCFANQRDPKPHAVESDAICPGAGGQTTPKIPTIIAYTKEDPSTFEWGACATGNKDAIVGIKLLLDPNQKPPYYLQTPDPRKVLKSLPKPPVEVAADFMKSIYQHALAEISKTVPQEYMKLCRKEHVLSVPAVWSDAAKDATLRAAEIAEISNITLIKEPEAAALYTAKSLDFCISRDDAFVICDAGGGTVDLVSYEVEAVLPRLKVRELVPGTGGMAGSLGLNNRFATALSQLVGDEQWPALKKSKAFFLADKQFDEKTKRDFKGAEDEEHYVNFPTAQLEDDPENGLQSNSWTLTGRELRSIFDPLITDILMLIEQQVQSVKIKRVAKGITGIFLVGGFGSSQYLRDRVQKHFPDIQVLQPNDAWAAIVKGATLSKLPREAIVTSTSSTRHYGVEAWSVFRSAEDLGQPTRVWRDGTTRVARMTWYIRVGDDLLRNQTIRFPFLRSIDEKYRPEHLIFRDELFECEDKIAPIHRSSGEKISINCVLTSDLSSVPDSKFIKRRAPDNQPYFDVCYDLVVTLESAVLKFSLEMDGKAMGTVEAKYS